MWLLDPTDPYCGPSEHRQLLAQERRRLVSSSQQLFEVKGALAVSWVGPEALKIRGCSFSHD
jgi:hypothetical protein